MNAPTTVYVASASPVGRASSGMAKIGAVPA